MIKRGVNDVKQICIENNFGGAGKMFLRQYMGNDKALEDKLADCLFPDDFESGLHFLHELILEPGGVIGAHTHKGSEEIYFLLEGEGEMTVDGEVVTLVAGDAILTGNNSTHSFKVTSDTSVKMVVVEAGVQ